MGNNLVSLDSFKMVVVVADASAVEESRIDRSGNAHSFIKVRGSITYCQPPKKLASPDNTKSSCLCQQQPYLNLFYRGLTVQ